MHIYDLLESFTVYTTTNPRISCYDCNVQGSSSFLIQISGWISQLVFSVHWNPEEVGSNASERMDLLAGKEHLGKEQKLPSSMSLYNLSGESMTQIRGGCSQLKYLNISPMIPTFPIYSGDLVFFYCPYRLNLCISLFGSFLVSRLSGIVNCRLFII